MSPDGDNPIKSYTNQHAASILDSLPCCTAETKFSIPLIVFGVKSLA